MQYPVITCKPTSKTHLMWTRTRTSVTLVQLILLWMVRGCTKDILQSLCEPNLWEPSRVASCPLCVFYSLQLKNIWVNLFQYLLFKSCVWFSLPWHSDNPSSVGCIRHLDCKIHACWDTCGKELLLFILQSKQLLCRKGRHSYLLLNNFLFLTYL